MWSDSEHLLAGIFDGLQLLWWMYATVHHDPDKPELPHPQRLPRPGEEPAAAESDPASKYLALADVPAASPAELAAWLNS